MRLLEEGDVCWKSFAGEKFEARLSAEADIARCVQQKLVRTSRFNQRSHDIPRRLEKSIVFRKDCPVTRGARERKLERFKRAWKTYES